MEKLTEKEVIALLNSLVHSGDLKLKTSIKDDLYEYIATNTLTYKGRKILSVKNSKAKKDAVYE